MRKTVKDHLGNEFKTQRDMCRHWGITLGLFHNRINIWGWEALEKVLTEPVCNRTKPCKDPFGNAFLSIRQMCEQYDISYYVYYRRIKDGWSQLDALTIAPGKRYLSRYIYDHKGNRFESETKLCQHHKIKLNRFNYLVKHGDPSEIATFKCINNIRRAIVPTTDHLGQSFRSFAELCQHWKRPKETVRQRLIKGMSLKEALETPVRKWQKKAP